MHKTLKRTVERNLKMHLFIFYDILQQFAEILEAQTKFVWYFYFCRGEWILSFEQASIYVLTNQKDACCI